MAKPYNFSSEMVYIASEHVTSNFDLAWLRLLQWALTV